MGCGSSRNDVVENQTTRLFSKVPNNVILRNGEMKNAKSTPPVLSANSVESRSTMTSNSTDSPGLLPALTGNNIISGETTAATTNRLNSSISFHIPLTSHNLENIEDATSLVKKYPPRRFQRLEDCQQQPDMQSYRDKLAVVEQRRQQIISNRVQSARSRSLRSAGRLRTFGRQTNAFGEIESGVGDARREMNTVIF